MQTVLVTGGSGYIASFCIAQLLDEGAQVRTTIRNLAREAELRSAVGRLTDAGERLEVMAADLTSDAGWAEAVRGCEGVLHVASPFFASRSEAEMVGPARDGTLRVLRAALDAGVQRIVLTSSTQSAAYPAEPRPLPWDETVWSDPNRPEANAYSRSKVIAERAAWDFVDKAGRRDSLAVVCPGAVFGPVLGRDYSFSLTVVERMLKGAMPGLPRIGFDIVDVRDIADLHLRALRDPAAAGERFLGVNGFLWFSDIAGVLRRELGPDAGKVPTRQLPSWLVRLVARFDPELKSITGDLDQRREHTGAKAKAVLGWNPRPPEVTLADCARCLMAEGVV